VRDIKTSRHPYQVAHQRVKAIRGKATGYRCVDCKGPASEWSLKAEAKRIGETHIVNVDGKAMEFTGCTADYEPRCSNCHRSEDARRQADFVASFEDVLTDDPYKGGI
jgi:hypothetical protein